MDAAKLIWNLHSPQWVRIGDTLNLFESIGYFGGKQKSVDFCNSCLLKHGYIERNFIIMAYANKNAGLLVWLFSLLVLLLVLM